MPVYSSSGSGPSIEYPRRRVVLAPDVKEHFDIGNVKEYFEVMDENARPLDAETLRALAHPIRWSLLEALGLEGSATATRCAQLIGESQATCSFHLRQLARFGLVEEAPSESKRERPWRLRSLRQSWSNEPSGDRGRDDAVRQVNAVFVDRETERIRRWARSAVDVPSEWRDAASMTGAVAWMTPAELDGFGSEFAALVERYIDRIEHPELRPEGARPVRVFGVGFPLFGLDAEASE
jgi:DNA-binding transcriptional ArsR family regulator